MLRTSVTTAVAALVVLGLFGDAGRAWASTAGATTPHPALTPQEATQATQATAGSQAGAKPQRAVAPAQAATKVDAEGYHIATLLGGATRIYIRRLKNTADLQVMAGNTTVQKELWAVFEKAELTPLAPDVLRILASANPDLLHEATFPVGGTMEWMAARRSGDAVDIIHKVRWGGKQPIDVWEFSVDDGKAEYKFAIAKPCGNLMFLGATPKPAPVVKVEERPKPQPKPEPPKPVVVPPPPPPPPPAPPAPPEMRFSEMAAAAGAIATTEELRRDRVDPFVEFAIGKIRGRSLYDCPPDIRCQVLSVEKGGADIRLAGPVRIAPAIGIAINLHNRKNSALFADLELNYWFSDKAGFIGTGVGIWDITHSETRTGAILAQGGVRLWKSDASGSGLYFILSGRVFTANLDDIANHYSFWGGLRFVIR